MKFYLLFGVISAQRKQWFGKCAEPPVLSDFDLARVCKLSIAALRTDFSMPELGMKQAATQCPFKVTMAGAQ